MVDQEYRDMITEEYGENLLFFDDHSYDGAIIGVSDDGCHIVYSYDKMIEELISDEDWDYDEAMELVDYNTIRALPYADANYRPIVVYDKEDVWDSGSNREAPRSENITEMQDNDIYIKSICSKFFDILDKKGLLKDDLQFDPGHFIETVAVPQILAGGRKKNRIICIVGPSGCGKSTLVEHCKEKHPGWNVIASYTTRAMRPGEVEGVGHRFVSESDVPDKSEMVAYTCLNGCHYWATRDQMREAEVTLYVVDEAGVKFFKDVNNDEFDIKTLYIECDNSTVDKSRRDRDKERIPLNVDEYDTVIRNDFEKDSKEEFLLRGLKAVEELVD